MVLVKLLTKDGKLFPTSPHTAKPLECKHVEWIWISDQEFMEERALCTCVVSNHQQTSETRKVAHTVILNFSLRVFFFLF